MAELSPSTSRGAAARAASDYYNALPITERRALAPLLEEYRRLGYLAALGKIELARNSVVNSIRGIEERNALIAASDQEYGEAKP